MQNSGRPVCDWEEYVEKYAEFIKRNKIEKYFELDIDAVVGYTRVKQLRGLLEKKTGSRVIPVWHLSRGFDEFKKMCDEYDYVAVGGIVSGEISPKNYNMFPLLITEAHKRNAKVHGLGFTNLAGIKRYHFDSVDSTAWAAGNRFGYLYFFNGETMKKRKPPEGFRICDSRAAALNNYIEWVKFQRYAENHL